MLIKIPSAESDRETAHFPSRCFFLSVPEKKKPEVGRMCFSSIYYFNFSASGKIVMLEKPHAIKILY